MPSIADAFAELNDKAMTRKEQIKEYLRVIGSGDMENIPFDVGFECGVEWADIHPHWISVEDELPPPLKPCLVNWDGKVLMGCLVGIIQNKADWYAWEYKSLEKKKGGLVMAGTTTEYSGISVTHWMPLPAPPTKGDQCND